MATQQTQAPDDQAPVNDEQDFENYFSEFASGSKPEEGEDPEQAGQPESRESNDGEDPDEVDSAGKAEDNTGGASPDDSGTDDGNPDDNQEPSLTEREKKLQADFDRLRQSEASQRGRVGALQRQINEMRRQQQSAAQPAKTPEQKSNQPGDSQQTRDQKQAIAEQHGSENWKRFAEDFPDIAGALDARFAELSRLEESFNQRFASIEQTVQPIQQQAHQQYLDSQMRALEARHSDWREVVNAPAFQQWLQDQPATVQTMMESEDAADAAALLDFFKGTQQDSRNDRDAAAQAEREKRNQRLAQAQGVQRRGQGQREAVPDEFDAAFNHFAKQQSR